MRRKWLFCVVVILLVPLTVFSGVVQEQEENAQKKKNPRYILCSRITKEAVQGVKASKRRIDNGVVIVMTSPNPVEVKNLKEIISSCQVKDEMKKNEREILSLTGVKINETNLNNGIRLELTSENPEVVDKIKRVRIPGFLRMRSKKDQEKK